MHECWFSRIERSNDSCMKWEFINCHFSRALKHFTYPNEGRELFVISSILGYLQKSLQKFGDNIDDVNELLQDYFFILLTFNNDNMLSDLCCNLLVWNEFYQIIYRVNRRMNRLESLNLVSYCERVVHARLRLHQVIIIHGSESSDNNYLMWLSSLCSRSFLVYYHKKFFGMWCKVSMLKRVKFLKKFYTQIAFYI